MIKKTFGVRVGEENSYHELFEEYGSRMCKNYFLGKVVKPLHPVG